MNNLQLQKLDTCGQLTMNYSPAKRHYESLKTPDQGVLIILYHKHRINNLWT